MYNQHHHTTDRPSTVLPTKSTGDPWAIASVPISIDGWIEGTYFIHEDTSWSIHFPPDVERPSVRQFHMFSSMSMYHTVNTSSTYAVQCKVFVCYIWEILHSRQVKVQGTTKRKDTLLGTFYYLLNLKPYHECVGVCWRRPKWKWKKFADVFVNIHLLNYVCLASWVLHLTAPVWNTCA